MARFHSTRRIQFAETDMAGIIHFSNFFKFMEESEHAFFRSLGTSVMSRHGDYHLTWPRVSATCDFLAPVRFEDEVDIGLDIARIGRSSVTFSFSFTLNGTEVATGSLVTACCALRDGALKSIPIPESLRNQMENAPR